MAKSLQTEQITNKTVALDKIDLEIIKNNWE